MKLSPILLVLVFLLAATQCKRENKEPENVRGGADTLVERAEEPSQGEQPTKRTLVEQNMQTLASALEGFARSTPHPGVYPAERSQTIADVYVAIGASRRDMPETYDVSIDSLLPSDFRNPYSDTLPAFSMSYEEPPDWTLEHMGQVIWIPVMVIAPRHDTLEQIALGYRLYGVAPAELMTLVLTSQGRTAAGLR